MWLYVPYVHKPESALKILRTRLGRGSLKTLLRYARFAIKNLTADSFKSKERNEIWIYARPAWLMLSGKECWSFSQTKNYSIRQHTGIGYDTSSCE